MEIVDVEGSLLGEINVNHPPFRHCIQFWSRDIGKRRSVKGVYDELIDRRNEEPDTQYNWPVFDRNMDKLRSESH